MEREKSFILDFMNRSVQDFYVMQFDKDSRVFYINIKDNNKPVDLTGHTVKVFGVKPDRQPIFNTVDIIDAETGLVKVTLTNQMTARNGAMTCILAIYGLDGTEIGTNLFRIIIEKNPRNDSAIESTSEFTALSEAIRKAEKFEINGQVLIDAWELQFQNKYNGLEAKYAPQLTDIKSSLAEKVSKNQGTSNVGKILAVGSDGNLTLVDMPSGGGGGDIIGMVDENNNVILSGSLANGTYLIAYENSDGTQTEIGSFTIGTVTELFVPSTCTINSRISSSGAVSSQNSTFVTDYIDIGTLEVGATKDILFSGFQIQMNRAGTPYTSIQLYDANKARLGVMQIGYVNPIELDNSGRKTFKATMDNPSTAAAGKYIRVVGHLGEDYEPQGLNAISSIDDLANCSLILD